MPRSREILSDLHKITESACWEFRRRVINLNFKLTIAFESTIFNESVFSQICTYTFLKKISIFEISRDRCLAKHVLLLELLYI